MKFGAKCSCAARAQGLQSSLQRAFEGVCACGARSFERRQMKESQERSARTSHQRKRALLFVCGVTVVN